MQTAKDQIVDPSAGHNPTVMPVKLADADATATASPAIELRDQLHRAFDAADADETWSYRRTAAFLMVTCGGFWAGLALIASRMV